MRDSSSDEVMCAIQALEAEKCLDFYECVTKVALEARNSSKEKLA